MGIHKVTLEMVLYHTTKAQPVCTRAYHARADENSGLSFSSPESSQKRWYQ